MKPAQRRSGRIRRGARRSRNKGVQQQQRGKTQSGKQKTESRDDGDHNDEDSGGRRERDDNERGANRNRAEREKSDGEGSFVTSLKDQLREEGEAALEEAGVPLDAASLKQSLVAEGIDAVRPDATVSSTSLASRTVETTPVLSPGNGRVTADDDDNESDLLSEGEDADDTVHARRRAGVTPQWARESYEFVEENVLALSILVVVTLLVCMHRTTPTRVRSVLKAILACAAAYACLVALVSMPLSYQTVTRGGVEL